METVDETIEPTDELMVDDDDISIETHSNPSGNAEVELVDTEYVSLYHNLEAKKLESKRLEDEVEVFLANGGAIQQVPAGATCAKVGYK